MPDLPAPRNSQEDAWTLVRILGHRVRATAHNAEYEFWIYGWETEAYSDNRLSAKLYYRYGNAGDTERWRRTSVPIRHYSYTILE